jgi:hypothetical protein
LPILAWRIGLHVVQYGAHQSGRTIRLRGPLSKVAVLKATRLEIRSAICLYRSECRCDGEPCISQPHHIKTKKKDVPGYGTGDRATNSVLTAAKTTCWAGSYLWEENGERAIYKRYSMARAASDRTATSEFRTISIDARTSTSPRQRPPSRRLHPPLDPPIRSRSDCCVSLIMDLDGRRLPTIVIMDAKSFHLS